MAETWKPNVVVAAIIEREGRFLLVEEETSEGVRLNQPAGHLEPRESLADAVVRETLEETAHDFTPTGLVGTYLSSYLRSDREVTYLRFTFCGTLGAQHDRPLDRGILRTVWMTAEEILACPERHRSPMVLRSLQDYLAGQRAPLALVVTHPSALGVKHG